MRRICILSHHELTIGKEYVILNINNDVSIYWLINDKGVEIMVYSHYFVSSTEYRNIQIDRIIYEDS